jgi:hypothetical protein
MLSKQSTSAAINRRMRDPRFDWPDAPRGVIGLAVMLVGLSREQKIIPGDSYPEMGGVCLAAASFVPGKDFRRMEGWPS